MVSLCEPLRSIGIDYLSYTRVYNNGDRIYLVSLPIIMEDFFSNKKYLYCGNDKHPDSYDSGQIILWSTLPNQAVYQEAKLMGAGHGLYLFGEKTDDYCDSLGFATSEDDNGIVNNYFNNLETIINFLPNFHEKASKLLKQAERHKLVLPFNEGEIITASHSSFSLTARQQDCAYLLMQGMSAKAIAKELKLSYRTIECYLHNLKVRLGCKSKTELIIKLGQLPNYFKK